MLIAWQSLCIDIDRLEPSKQTEQVPPKKTSFHLHVLLAPAVIGVMVAIVLQGMLRDGIGTWMPSYIDNTYHLGTAISILTSVLLPLFSILCTKITALLYQGKLKNPLLCSAVIFSAGALATIGLVLTSGKSALLSVAFSALLFGTMHGVTTLLTSMVPQFFQKHGNVSMVAGVLNACTYVGSAISTYGIAVISGRISWNFTLVIWCGIALLGALVCFLCVRPWKKNFQNE
jgi:OPA family glycerol-3-phosphate transporter-like MFS transporter